MYAYDTRIIFGHEKLFPYKNACFKDTKKNRSCEKVSSRSISFDSAGKAGNSKNRIVDTELNPSSSSRIILVGGVQWRTETEGSGEGEGGVKSLFPLLHLARFRNSRGTRLSLALSLLLLLLLYYCCISELVRQKKKKKKKKKKRTTK